MLKVASRRSRGILTPYVSSFDAGLVFSPLAITGLKVWLKADAITGLGDGASITTWQDSSGNNFNPTQASSTLKPLYKTGILNGLPVVRFDGTDDYLDYLGAICPSGAQPLTVFAVVKATSFASFPEILQIGNTHSSVTDGYQTLIYSDGAMYGSNMGNNNERYTAASTLATGTFYALTYEIAGAAFSSTNPKFYRNGTQQSSTRGTGTSTPSINPVRFRIGATVQPGQYFPGDFAEVLVYNAVLSSTDRAAVEAYLMAKWGL